ncbi:asparaginase [Streptomyces sp. AJS327]|uniref:asparaginase n=1 Tax=Streptomyces sp. AJS327 TaxID=2545265 RepID=UPI0015DF5F80|nr:asparaginase [Streptomyces sp. AJS327]MBA0052466.1 asparaginase [Streptomyces sp. AJS327]
MSRVELLATGGTISCRWVDGSLRATATGADILATAPVPSGREVTVTDVATRPGFAWEWPELVGLVRQVRRALSSGDVAGVVVTHGTDTMEETSFLTALAHDDPRPVVFTGAQRPFDHPAADGPANLAQALLIAGHPAARDRGVLLAFDGLAYAARGVAKADTLSTRGFAAPGRGPVLRVAGERVLPLAPPRRPPSITLDPSTSALPRVDVIPLYAGADTTLLDAAVAAGARGLVLAAFGAGNANPPLVKAVRGCGLPVLVCSRVPAGPVLPLYGGGGGADLAEAGAVGGEDLSPWQGRMLLAAALAAAPDSPEHLLRHWLSSSAAP